MERDGPILTTKHYTESPSLSRLGVTKTLPRRTRLSRKFWTASAEPHTEGGCLTFTTKPLTESRSLSRSQDPL